MKKIIISLGIVACSHINAQSNCDCTIIPWTPKKCFDKCSINFLNQSSELQIKDALQISLDLSKKVKTTLQSKNVKKIEDFEPHLTKSEYNTLKSKIESYK